MNFLQQHGRVHHYAPANQPFHARVEDAGWHEVNFEGAILVDNGMAGVVAAVEAGYVVVLPGKGVNSLSFAFVAPLRSQNNRYAHRSSWKELLF